MAAEAAAAAAAAAATADVCGGGGGGEAAAATAKTAEAEEAADRSRGRDSTLPGSGGSGRVPNLQNHIPVLKLTRVVCRPAQDHLVDLEAAQHDANLRRSIIGWRRAARNRGCGVKVPGPETDYLFY